MKPSSNLQQRFEAAGLLLGILLIILFTAQSLKTTVKEMDRTMSSLYADRLQPAVDLVHISESLHAKRLVLENEFMTESPLPPSDLAV